MATLERGKGRRRQVIEIAQHGSVLRMQETDAGDKRLPGYRRFPNDAAAGGALAAEVQAQLDAGMQPADDDARAIAAARPPGRGGPPVLPVRVDLGIYNEATGFVVTSRRMAGKTLEEGSAEWTKAVRRGDMLPLMLVQDDPFVIRIVAGGPLTEQEEEEWIARVDWHLNVPDGKLCVTGGSVFTNDDYDEDDPHHEQYVGQAALPKGRYRAVLYTHVHGVNGGSVLDHLAGGYHRGESLEAWFARTRPGDTPPGADDLERVDFLLHLEPIDGAPKAGLSVLPDDGWFAGAENARKPERCPLGLVATDVVRPREDVPGRWTYVRNVFENMPATDRRLVKGKAVSVPLDSISRAARIAWFGSRFTTIELRLTPPSGGTLDFGGDWPEGVVAVQEGGVGRILFDADLDISAIVARLPELAPRLGAQPAGTVLDLCCDPLEGMPGSPEDAGRLALRGPIRDGMWRIAQAYPEVDGATLDAGLTLAAEVEGQLITVRDATEGEAILAWANRRFGAHLEGNRPRRADGGIRFGKPGHEVALVGIAAFTRRFAGTWPVTTVEDQEEDDGGDGMFPAMPIKGAEVFRAPSGRVYHATMAMLVSEKAGSEVPKRERPLLSAGYKHLGDVVCSELENVGVRGYTRPDGQAWACLRVSAPCEIQFEIASTFGAGDAVLVTTADPNERDDAGSKTFRQGFAGAGLEDLVAHHERRLAELTPALGAPRPVARTLQSLAETIEAVLRKS